MYLDLDEKRLDYQQFFISPFLQDEASEFQFIELLNKIGSWPEVLFVFGLLLM
jgi:hypothetical protein